MVIKSLFSDVDQKAAPHDNCWLGKNITVHPPCTHYHKQKTSSFELCKWILKQVEYCVVFWTPTAADKESLSETYIPRGQGS